jgi:alpha-galactosidase
MLTRLTETSRTRERRGAQKVCKGRFERVLRLLGCFFLVNFAVIAILRGKPMGAISDDARTAVAVRMTEPADAEGFPTPASWEAARSVRFDTDWQGKNADPERETEVRMLWTADTLYLRFRSKYRVITVFSDAEANGRRDQLWDRDVAEVFLQANPSEPRRYKEFEVSPNGMWIDLDIAPGEKHDLKSGLRRRVVLSETAKTWVAELALPMKSLVERFDPAANWRMNFYRVEGEREPRFYSAWQPTGTAVANFHVPEAFGKLVFAPAALKRER